jgi:hypothetical protein
MFKRQIGIADYSRWLIERGNERPGRFVFLTLTFDRARKFYSLGGHGADEVPGHSELAGGTAMIMPKGDATRALIADLERFYCMMLRALLGRRYARRFDLQPFAIGALDEPCYKRPDKRSALSRKVGEVFDHAHFILHIPDVEVRGRRLPDLFESLLRDGSLIRLWRRLNSEGEVHASGIFYLAGALDYSLKAAKRQNVPSDEILIWPVGVPRRPPC